jgi:N-acetylmuramoyl-L-alanine amidase
MQIKFAGCDISHHQGDIDFSKLKRKVDFCIIKLGGTDTTSGNWYIDKRFNEYYNECKKHKIPVGCYWFAGRSSVGVERGIYEARLVAKAIKDYQFEYPVYIDFEKGDTKSRISNTQFCTTFCDYLENKGFLGLSK